MISFPHLHWHVSGDAGRADVRCDGGVPTGWRLWASAAGTHDVGSFGLGMRRNGKRTLAR